MPEREEYLSNDHMAILCAFLLKAGRVSGQQFSGQLLQYSAESDNIYTHSDLPSQYPELMLNHVVVLFTTNCSLTKEHPPPTFGPIGSEFVPMRGHPGVSFA